MEGMWVPTGGTLAAIIVLGIIVFIVGLLLLIWLLRFLLLPHLREPDVPRPKGDKIGYCVSCGGYQAMLTPRQLPPVNGNPAVVGVCTACGSNIVGLGQESHSSTETGEVVHKHWSEIPSLVFVLAMRAALLDGRIYREIGEEPAAMFRALGTVIVVAIAFGLGLMFTDFESTQDSPMRVFLVVSTTMVLGWLLWGTIAYIVGSRALGGQATHRMLLRSLGVAYAPGIVMVLAGTPGVGGPVSVLGPLWVLASGMVAIRETLGYGWFRALLPAVGGWLVAMFLLFELLGPRVSSGG